MSNLSKNHWQVQIGIEPICPEKRFAGRDFFTGSQSLSGQPLQSLSDCQAYVEHKQKALEDCQQTICSAEAIAPDGQTHQLKIPVDTEQVLLIALYNSRLIYEHWKIDRNRT